MNVKRFGELLKLSRKKAGLTQKELGERVGVSQVVIANYERGARFPGEQILKNLAESLHVSLDYLLSVSHREQGDSVSHNLQINLNTLKNILLEEPVQMGWEYIRKGIEADNLTGLRVFSEILIPLMQLTGDLWASGEISIADEHLISGKVREIISFTVAYISELNRIIPDTQKTWIGLCAPGEKHDLALLMLSAVLKLRGWNTVFIGTDLPVSELLTAIEKYKPEVLCFSITIDSHAVGLEAYLQVLERNRLYDYKIILGGRCSSIKDIHKYPNVLSEVSSLEDAVRIIESI